MRSTVTLLGNVVDDVALRDAGSAQVANFSIAIHDRYPDRRTQAWKEQTTFVRVSAWRTLGENVAASVVKGQPVIVVGRLKQREFESDGHRRSVLEVEADLVAHDLRVGRASFARTPRGPHTAEVVPAAADRADPDAA